MITYIVQGASIVVSINDNGSSNDHCLADQLATYSSYANVSLWDSDKEQEDYEELV
jgi:hypothetical protein